MYYTQLWNRSKMVKKKVGSQWRMPHISQMRDISSTDFFYIKIAACARFACFSTILGTYQIIICTLLTPLELGIMNRRKRKENYLPFAKQCVDFSWMSKWYVEYAKIPVPRRIIHKLYYIDGMSVAEPLRNTRKSINSFFNPKIGLEVEGSLFSLFINKVLMKKIII